MISKFVISLHENESQYLKEFFLNNDLAVDEFKKIGIDGRKLTAADYYNKGVVGASTPLTPGEVGCKESHKLALIDFINSDNELALVLEDDTKRCEPGLISFDEFNIVKDAAFIILLSRVNNIPSKSLKGDFAGCINNKPLLRVNRFFYGPLHGADAYIINKMAAKQLTIFLEGSNIVDDYAQFLKINPDVKVYMIDLFKHPAPHDIDYKSLLENDRILKQKTKSDENKHSLFLQKKLFKICRFFLKFTKKSYSDLIRHVNKS